MPEEEGTLTAATLGSLTPVEPREVWQDEAGDFTPWLRDNIERLGATLGISFDTINTEEPVGRYNADLWGQEEGPPGRGIVIENQLTESNHEHLGKLITYAAGLESDIAVWVAPHFRDEHLAAIKYLNETSEGRRYYFAVQIELFRIDQSEPAPLFRVLAQPRNWSPRRRRPPGTPSPRMQAYHDFFERFLKVLKQRAPGVTQMTRVGYQGWLNIPAGKSGFVFAASFARGERFRVELYIDEGDKGKNKKAYDALESQRAAIQGELEAELSWERLDEARASRIAEYTSGSISYSPEKLQELTDWAVPRVLKFRDVFGGRIRPL
jgi:hypothetical protein